MRSFLFLILLLSSCSSNPKIETVSKLGPKMKQQVLPVFRKRKEPFPDYIKNEYLKIALAQCSEYGNFKYDRTNYSYFDLDPKHPKNCFVYYSQLQCGAPGGSCGYDIEVYQKTETGYKQVYHACGTFVKQSNEVHFGIRSFDFTMKDGTTYRVSYNGKQFEEKPILFRGKDYRMFSLIEKLTNWPLEAITLEKMAFDNGDLFSAKVETCKIGPNKTAELFILNDGNRRYVIVYYGKPLFDATDRRGIEFQKKQSEGYFDIKTLCSYDWLANDSLYSVQADYSYSKSQGKYLKRFKSFNSISK